MMGYSGVTHIRNPVEKLGRRTSKSVPLGKFILMLVILTDKSQPDPRAKLSVKFGPEALARS